MAAYISGSLYVDVAARGETWDATDIPGVNLTMHNVGAFDQTYVGTNPTTANPTPVNDETVLVEAAGGTFMTGGSVDVFGTLSGTLVLRKIVEPFVLHDVWVMITFDSDRALSLQMCAVFDTASFIPLAIEFLNSGGLFDFRGLERTDVLGSGVLGLRLCSHR